VKAIGRWNITDVDEILALHAEMLSRYGGTAGAANRGCVEGSIGSAANAALYKAEQDEEPDLLSLVAHVLVYLARNHCFTDGNKRAAWSATVRILDLNGLRLRSDDPEAALLVERVCTRNANVDEVILWLGNPERIRARSETGGPGRHEPY
jgi:death on curing protein